MVCPGIVVAGELEEICRCRSTDVKTAPFGVCGERQGGYGKRRPVAEEVSGGYACQNLRDSRKPAVPLIELRLEVRIKRPHELLTPAVNAPRHRANPSVLALPILQLNSEMLPLLLGTGTVIGEASLALISREPAAGTPRGFDDLRDDGVLFSQRAG